MGGCPTPGIEETSKVPTKVSDKIAAAALAYQSFKEHEIRMNTSERVLGQIDIECYMIQRGKPAALIPIKKRAYQHYKLFVEKYYNLEVMKQDLNDEWVSLYIYKNNYIKEIIESLPEQPKTKFDHWVLGKLFGYSDEAINDFLNLNFN